MFETKAAVFYRLTATDARGNEHTVELPMADGMSYEAIFRAAHSREDGDRPTPEDCDRNTNLFFHALALRQAEDGLRALCDVPA